MITVPMPFILDTHVTNEYGEWGCAPRKPVVEFDYAHRGEWMASVIGRDPGLNEDRIYHIVRCENCIYTHLFPLCSQQSLDDYYQWKFYQTTKRDYLRSYQEDRDWWLMTHRTVFDAAQPWLPEKALVLDVGSGPGYPLDVATERNYRAWALEASPIPCQALRDRGYYVINATFAEYWQAYQDIHMKGNYDCLYLWEVLEHQPTPEDFLLKCYDLLKPGGVLVMAVPNDFSPAQFEVISKYGIKEWWIAPPDHQCYFTPKTLQLLVRRCGFKIHYTRMTFPLIEHFILDQDRMYIGSPVLGRKCHHERVAYEMEVSRSGGWQDLEVTYISNVGKREGREIIMIATKE